MQLKQSQAKLNVLKLLECYVKLKQKESLLNNNTCTKCRLLMVLKFHKRFIY